jgi:Cft2 family RNA processing exonuclease
VTGFSAVNINGHTLLLECGLYQGRAKSYERNRNLPFHAQDIDSVILSHAHIDHSGNLPLPGQEWLPQPDLCHACQRSPQQPHAD